MELEKIEVTFLAKHSLSCALQCLRKISIRNSEALTEAWIFSLITSVSPSQFLSVRRKNCYALNKLDLVSSKCFDRRDRLHVRK